jgi:uncharacterized membrane protein
MYKEKTAHSRKNEVCRMYQTPSARQHKLLAVFAYLLFFLPLLVARRSRFAMFHCNQGLVLLLAFLACNTMLSMIAFIGWLLVPLANMACVFLMIIGMLNAAGGIMRPLPVIGKLRLIE